MNVIKSMYSSIRSCVKINQNTLTELFTCNKGIRRGDGLSPVLFSLFMNDLPQYFKQNKSPGVMLGNRSINCLMYADDCFVWPCLALAVISCGTDHQLKSVMIINIVHQVHKNLINVSITGKASVDNTG